MDYFNFIGNTNICNLLPISTDVTYDHLLGRNPYISKRPKRQWSAFPLALLSSLALALARVDRIGMKKNVRTNGLQSSHDGGGQNP